MVVLGNRLKFIAQGATIFALCVSTFSNFYTFKWVLYEGVRASGEPNVAYFRAFTLATGLVSVVALFDVFFTGTLCLKCFILMQSVNCLYHFCYAWHTFQQDDIIYHLFRKVVIISITNDDTYSYIADQSCIAWKIFQGTCILPFFFIIIAYIFIGLKDSPTPSNETSSQPPSYTYAQIAQLLANVELESPSYHVAIPHTNSSFENDAPTPRTPMAGSSDTTESTYPA